jgi:hypothetical protein
VTSSGLRIDYRRSGGFAGIEMTAEVRADELAAGEAELAGRLLADASVGEPTKPANAFPGAADQFSYQLNLTDGSRKHTFHWAEFQVPDAVRPLLTALNQRAKPA